MPCYIALFSFAIFLPSEAGVPAQLSLKQQRALTDARALIESVRRLGTSMGYPAECVSACPAVENIGNSLNKKMQEVQQKHAASMMAMMQKQPQDGNMDPEAFADMLKAMEPMYGDIMGATVNNMCDNKDGYACLVQNADKCSASTGAVSTGSMSMGMGMDPVQAANDMGSQLECMCSVCPATKDAYIKMMSTVMVETMGALTQGLASMGEALKDGADGADALQSADKSMESLDANELQKTMMLSVCPMVGMSRCFEANPTECKGMIDQGFSKVEASSAKSTLGQELATLKADCEKAGVSTASPQTVEKVTTVVTLKGLDYDKVMADTTVKNGIIATVKSKFLAKMPGYKENDLKVTLSKGSVKATVEIVPMPGADAASVKAIVEQNKNNVQAAIVADVKKMDKVDSVLESGATKDQIQASTSNTISSGGGPASDSDSTASGAHLARMCMISFCLAGLSILKSIWP